MACPWPSTWTQPSRDRGSEPSAVENRWLVPSSPTGGMHVMKLGGVRVKARKQTSAPDVVLSQVACRRGRVETPIAVAMTDMNSCVHCGKAASPCDFLPQAY